MGHELDAAVAAHRARERLFGLSHRQQQQQQGGDNSSAPGLGMRAGAGDSDRGDAGGGAAPRLRPAPLRRPLPLGTAAALLDSAAARARAAVRDFARGVADALPVVTIDLKESRAGRPAWDGGGDGKDRGGLEGGAEGGGEGGEEGGGRRRAASPRRRHVMVEVPPSEWMLAEGLNPKWRLAGGRGGGWAARGGWG